VGETAEFEVVVVCWLSMLSMMLIPVEVVFTSGTVLQPVTEVVMNTSNGRMGRF
jgi:hypothetical protein